MSKQSTYNWNVLTLEDKLKEYSLLLEKEEDLQKKAMLERDVDMLKDYISSIYKSNAIFNDATLLEYYEVFRQDLKSIYFLWDDYFNFLYKIEPFLEKEEFPKLPMLPTCSLSKEDIVTLTHDFFKNLDSFYYNHFMKFFSNRKSHLAFNGNLNTGIVGLSMTLIYKPEAYFNILREYTANDVITTIHEYTHSISVSINHEHHVESKILYMEIDTLFMELLATDFLQRTTNLPKLTILKSDSLDHYFDMAANLTGVITIIEAEDELKDCFKSNRELKQTALREYDLDGETVESLLNSNNNYNQEMYLTGYLYAIELYELYKKDPEKALFILRKFIELKAINEQEIYHKLADEFGLIPNQSIDSFQQSLSKELKRIAK